MGITTSSIHVLHVDDESEFADLTATYLEREDARTDVTVASSAEKGLDVLAETEVDCIVSDHDMPKMDGIEFLEVVREEYPELPFILFTGKGSEEVASEAISAGVTDYLQKSPGTEQYTLLANRIGNAVDRARSRRALEERKRHLETLISNLPGLVYRCRNEPHWPIVDVEGECEELTGYAASEVMEDVLWGRDVIHPEDRERIRNRVDEATQKGEPFELTYRILTADGTTRWVWERGRLVSGNEGEMLEGFITDITERKRREQRIEGLHASTRRLLEAETKGEVADAVAEAANRTLGYSNNVVRLLSEDGTRLVPVSFVSDELPEEISARPVYEVGEETAGKAFEAGEPIVYDDIQAVSDGRDRGAARAGIYLPMGDHGVLTVTEMDPGVFDEDDVKLASILAANAAAALDRVEHARRLREQTRTLQRYERIVETMADPVYELDTDGNVRFVNDAFTEFTGYERNELLGGRSSSDVDGKDGENTGDTQTTGDLIRKLLENGEDENLDAYEVTIHTAAGEARQCEIRQTQLRDDDGERRGIVGTIHDVTDRRIRERELKRYKLISDAIDDAVYALDTDGTIVYANDRYADLKGVERDALMGSRIEEWSGQETLEHSRKIREEMQNGGTDVRWIEWTIPTAEGEPIPVEQWFLNISRDDGPTERVGLIRDISDRKKRERELERYELIFEALQDAVYALDTDDRLTYVNDSYAELKGADREELIGSRIAEWGDEDTIERAAEVRSELEVDELDTATIERDVLVADGEPMPAELRLIDARREDGGIERIGVIRDVSDRKERERRLEALHEATRELIEAETDEEIAEITAEAARETLEYENVVVRLLDEAEDLLRPVALTDVARRELGERPMYPVGEGTAGRAFDRQEPLLYENVERIDDGYPRGDGTAAMYLPLGEYGTISISDTEPGVFDQSDIEMARILAANAGGALRVVDQQRKLERQNDRLEEFVGIVSHDLRNPLNVAEGYLKLVDEECDSAHVTEVSAAHDRMGGLIDDLLMLAREGESVRETEAVDLGDLAEDCWRNVDTGSATLMIETDAVIVADRSRLKRLLENVIRNAVEHSSTSSRTQSGDAVEHSSASPPSQAREDGDTGVTVTIGSCQGGFYVADDGPGIPEEKRERVFEAGYSSTEDGTGFGLSIVKRIADAHNWEVALTKSDSGGVRIEIVSVDEPS